MDLQETDIYKIAGAAGVDHSTVKRVLEGRPTHHDNRVRVIDAMRATGYDTLVPAPGPLDLRDVDIGRIAHAARVDRRTVKGVLAGTRAARNSRARSRVLHTMRELGYSPECIPGTRKHPRPR